MEEFNVGVLALFLKEGGQHSGSLDMSLNLPVEREEGGIVLVMCRTCLNSIWNLPWLYAVPVRCV